MSVKKINIRIQKVLTILLVLSLVSVRTYCSTTNLGPTINIDNKVLKTNASTGYPVFENSRTLVPIRIITEELGYTVDWQGTKEPITISNGSSTVVITLGSKTASVNGKTVSLDVAPKLIGSRTYVPLRFVGESLGALVWWDGATQTAYISTTGEKFETSTSKKFSDFVTTPSLGSENVLFDLQGDKNSVKIIEASLDDVVIHSTKGEKIDLEVMTWASSNKRAIYVLTDANTTAMMSILMAAVKDGKITETYYSQTTVRLEDNKMLFFISLQESISEFTSADKLIIYGKGDTQQAYIVENPAKNGLVVKGSTAYWLEMENK